MSAPGLEFREAEYLGLGFLAITSSELIKGLIAGHTINEDDRHTLLRAKRFLEDVSSGARLVTSGATSNVSAVDSVRKFAYAVEPLKFMQDHIRASDVGEAFPRIASAIQETVDSGHPVDPESLAQAMDFFRQLHAFLTSLAAAGKRRTGGLKIGSSPSAYA